jgi:hypothetical protein
MGYITILIGTQPWIVCIPTDKGDLDRFLKASAALAVGGALTHRPATPAETAKCSAARALHIYAGGAADKFFGISV